MCDVALIIDTEHETWKDFEGADPKATLILSRLEDFVAVAIGLDFSPHGITVRGFAQLTEAAAGQGESASLAQLERDRALAISVLAEQNGGEPGAAVAAALALLENIETQRSGGLVIWTSFLEWDTVAPLAAQAAAVIE